MTTILAIAIPWYVAAVVVCYLWDFIKWIWRK